MPPILMHFLAPDRRTVYFAIKAVCAVALSLSISIHLDLDKPFWAVVASMMLQARPETGLVIEKAGFLVLGTVIGALLAMLVLDAFMPAPIVALGCLALIIGATAMMSATVRHVNFVYAFSLVSVTALMITMFVMSDAAAVSSESVFHIVFARISETSVGALSATLASLILFPLRVEQALTGHANGTVGATLKHLATLFDARTSPQQRKKQRQSIVTLAATISDDSNAGRFEEARNVRPSLHIANLAISLVAITQAIEQLTQDHPEIFDQDTRRLLSVAGAGFGSLSIKANDAATEKLPGVADELGRYREAHSLSPLHEYLVQSVEELVRLIDQMLAALASMERGDAVDFKVERFTSHRDPVVGAIAAFRSVAAFLLCAAIWIVSGGTPALVMMMVLPVLFAQMFSGAPFPALLVRRIAVGTLVAIPVAAVFALGTLAKGTGSLGLLLPVFCGPLFIALMGMTSKDAMPYSLGFCISFAALVQPSNYMSFSIDQSITIGLGLGMALLVLNFCFELVGRPSGVFLQRRIIHAIAGDLRKIGDRRRDRQWFNRQMAERLLYLGSREIDNRYSAQMTLQGLVGLDLGHAALQVHEQLSERLNDCAEPGLRDCLVAWRDTMAQAFLSASRGRRSDRLGRVSAQLVDAVRRSRQAPGQISVLEGTIERVRSSLDRLSEENRHSKGIRGWLPS